MSIKDQSIEQKATKGIAWRYAEEITTKVVSFVVTVVLARLLVPADYALVSIAAIIISCVDIFIDSGLSTAIIQKGNADKEDYETVMSFSMCVSIVLYFIIFFTAPVIGRLYQNEELAKVIRILCLVIIVKSLRNILSTNIRANLQFKKLFFSSFAGTACSAVAGIVLAFNGYGVWALVVQQLTDAIIDTLIMWISVPVKFAPRFSLSRLKSLFPYSSKMLIANIVTQISNAVSPVIISLGYSTIDLAYYTKAKGLSGYMLGFIETPLSQVLFPALSKIKDDYSQLLSFMRKFYRALYFFTFPVLCGLFVVADDFVLLLLTAKWSFLVPYLRVFIIAMLFNKNIECIKAIGRSDLFLKAKIICHILGLIYLLIALVFFDNPISIAWAYVPKCITYFLVQVYLERKYLDYKIINQLKDLLPSLISSIIMAVAVYLVSQIQSVSALSVPVRLILQVIFGILIYAVLSLLVGKKEVCWKTKAK